MLFGILVVGVCACIRLIDPEADLDNCTINTSRPAGYRRPNAIHAGLFYIYTHSTCRLLCYLRHPILCPPPK